MSFQADALATIEALLRYGHDSESQRHPAIDQRPMAELIEALDLEKLMATSEFSGERYARFLEGYLSATTRFRHPGNVAHQQAVPHYMAALAGLIDGYVNNDGGTYECGPAAVSIEYFLINWLIERVGWIPSPVPPHAVPGTGHAAGVMVQGGSISCLLYTSPSPRDA